MVQEVLDKLNLYKLWQEYEADFTCVREANVVTSVAKLEHFFIS